MELKDFQRKALAELESYLQALKVAQDTKRKIEETGLDIRFSVTEDAWEKRGIKKPYQAFHNGLGEDTPSVCLKVPTGGGKTLLASWSVELINRDYRNRRNGFVLWIVPSNQIYRQTLGYLRNREHPYRQLLDRASGGKTLILEKNDRFTRQQVEEQLVVMLLMLPSANRERKETLKLFQDNVGFETFFPPEENGIAQKELIEQFPNLEWYGEKDSLLGAVAKTSLGNTLRLIQPLVILDEGHKSYSEQARNTIRTFNPCFVLELSATPRTESNVLVSITGQELNREEMIKLDLNITTLASPEWQDALLAGVRQIERLEQEAQVHYANTGEYIRPICLIQVERTGKGQNTGRFIHTDDAQSFLMQNCGVRKDQIAIKTAQNDGLEDIDLLQQDCPIQYIITKSALQEGWDCAFAYVLVVLTNPTSQSGITQLVGRILRQPNARKTKVQLLDESYVFCYRKRAKELIRAVQQGFEDEGLGDLKGRVRKTDEDEYEIVRYRSKFQQFEGRIYLPRFVIQEADGYRDLSYEMDILSEIEWDRIDLSELHVTLGAVAEENRRVRVGLTDDPHTIVKEHLVETTKADLDVDLVFMTHQISDVVPNPWIAYDLVDNTLNLFQDYPPERIAHDLALIVSQLKVLLTKQRDKLAAEVFTRLLAEKRLCFFLQTIPAYALPSTMIVRKNQPKLTLENNDTVQLSLFEYYPEEEFNEVEKAVAVYLDKQEKLLWWYRNIVKGKGYEVSGWKKNKIYADFVAAEKAPDDDHDYTKVYVLETKGLHLKGNEDTEYKRNIFELCNTLGKPTNWEELGEEFGKKRVEFQVIFEDEWQTKINELFV